MLRKYILVILFLASAVCTASAQTTGFTYQGKLNDGANPANGTYDMQFKIFDTSVVGTGVQQGPTVTNASVAVSSGVFTVQLGFGFEPFSGPPRFLEIGVRPSGSPNAYTVLGPRSLINSTPYSIRSLTSSVADTLSSACVGCVTIQQIGGLPAGSANYIQNTSSIQSSSNFNISGTGAANILNARTQFNLNGARVLYLAPASVYLGPFAGEFNTTGDGNTYVGDSSGRSNTAGSSNSFFGRSAGISNDTASFNSFFGAFSGFQNTIGSLNSFFGASAGTSNTQGHHNAFFGANAGLLNVGGFSNAFFGSSAGQNNTIGTLNTFIGDTAGVSNTSGQQNTFVGQAAGNTNTTGLLNAFFGYASGSDNTTGQKNSFYGVISGSHNTTGQQNSFFGNAAGTTNTTGSSNTMLGASTDVASANLSYATAVGAESIASLSNSIYLGRPSGADAVRIPGSTVIDGTLVVGTLGSAGATSICLNAANRISPCSSSLRYKTSVQTFSRGLDIVRRLRPIMFDWKDGGMRDVGFGAEEVNTVEPLLTTRNSSGEVEGVKYAQITTVLVNAVKEQQSEIESQRRQIEEQQRQLLAQQKSIDALKRIVCRQNASAEVCKEEK